MSLALGHTPPGPSYHLSENTKYQVYRDALVGPSSLQSKGFSLPRTPLGLELPAAAALLLAGRVGHEAVGPERCSI